jgi:hypothetical protein
MSPPPEPASFTLQPPRTMITATLILGAMTLLVFADDASETNPSN